MADGMTPLPGFSPLFTPNLGGGGMDPFTGAALISGGMNLLGGLFGGIGQGKMQDKQLKLQKELAQQQMGMQGSQLDPLRQQRFRQNMALLSAIMPQVRNARVQGPAGYGQWKPQMSGGISNLIPEGGFGPDVLNFFSPASRMAAERSFFASNPNVKAPNLGSVGYGAANEGLMNNFRPRRPRTAELAEQGMGGY